MASATLRPAPSHQLPHVRLPSLGIFVLARLSFLVSYSVSYNLIRLLQQFLGLLHRESQVHKHIPAGLPDVIHTPMG